MIFNWAYHGESGPTHWASAFPKCGRASQSPVALYSLCAILNTTWPPIVFRGYDKMPDAMTLRNTGHSALVNLKMVPPPTVTGGDLPEYTFQQFHLHWGSIDTQGSEHTIDGVRFPAELHLVHYRSSYGKPQEAIQYADGLLVVAVMLQASNTDNPRLKSIMDGIPKIHKQGGREAIVPFPLMDLLPNNTNHYFRYMGSLTTPPCDEVVVWTVFANPISISSAQLAELRKLEDAHKRKLQDNFRPLQLLNKRTIYKVILP